MGEFMKNAFGLSGHVVLQAGLLIRSFLIDAMTGTVERIGIETTRLRNYARAAEAHASFERRGVRFAHASPRG